MFAQERLENAISYFSHEHKRRSGEPLTSLRLYKYIGLMEHWGFSTHGKPVFDLTFKAMQMGPVPIEVYDKRKAWNTPLFQFVPYKFFKPDAQFDGAWTVMPKGKPDLGFFSKQEIVEMDRLLEIFAQKGISSQDMSDASHDVVTAWKKTWKVNQNGIIDWGLTYPVNPKEKPAADLSPEEEQFLLSLGFKSLRRKIA